MFTSKLRLFSSFVLRVSTDGTSSGRIEEVTYFNRTAGQTVTFPCTSNSTKPVADWWVHNKTLHQICSAGLIINSFKTEGRFKLQKAFGGDWSLVVRNVRPSDKGVYLCRFSDTVVVQYNLTVLRKCFLVLALYFYHYYYYYCKLTAAIFWHRFDWFCLLLGGYCSRQVKNHCIGFSRKCYGFSQLCIG